MDKETQSLLDEMQAEGNTFEGIEPKDEKSKEETPAPEPEKEQKMEQEGEKPEEEAKEEPEEGVKAEADELPERTPRKPKEIPAWKAKIAEKRAAKELAEAKKPEEPELKTNQERQEEQSDAKSKIAKLKEKYKDTVTENFLDDFAELIPDSPKVAIPQDVQDKLAKLDELLASNQQSREDAEYNKAFSKQVEPLLKEQYPHISLEDLQSVQDQLKEHYFDERYINLSPKEIYSLKAEELKDLVSPPKKGSVEKGTRGVGRSSEDIDFENVTEAQYNAMSDEDRQKVEDYKIAQQKKRS